MGELLPRKDDAQNNKREEKNEGVSIPGPQRGVTLFPELKPKIINKTYTILFGI